MACIPFSTIHFQLSALSSQLSPVTVVKCLIHSEQMMCFASMRFPFLWVESTTDSILSSIFVRNLQSTAKTDATNIHTSRSQLNVDTSPVIDDHSQNDFINNNGFFIGLWSNFTLKMYIGWLWPVTIFDQRVELVSFFYLTIEHLYLWCSCDFLQIRVQPDERLMALTSWTQSQRRKALSPKVEIYFKHFMGIASSATEKLTWQIEIVFMFRCNSHWCIFFFLCSIRYNRSLASDSMRYLETYHYEKCCKWRETTNKTGSSPFVFM